MALAESFLRKLHKLGAIPRLVKMLPALSILLAFASVAWLLVLPMEGQYRNTYISENALMPGQVTSYFRESEWNVVRGYRQEVKKWNFAEASDSNPILEAWLEDVGFKVSHHHDTVTNSTTMYAIMHASRGDNTESVVLAAPYFVTGTENLSAFAIVPALARYFSKMSIWSKNIILVFPKDGHAVLRSWVEAYHTSLDLTAGLIEAAIVMEYPTDLDNFDHMELIYEGLNGQLPNLDLINTATTIARNEQMKVNVQKTPNSELTMNTYKTRLRTLLRGILHLALAGLSRGATGCEAFSGWQIQAITIRAVGSGGPDITQFARIIDSTFRAVNNLLEKFHQSFFFYLLLSPTNFVSISTYLPAAALLAVAFAISSLCCLANGVSASDYVSNLGQLLSIFTGIEASCLAIALVLLKAAESGSVKPIVVITSAVTLLVSFGTVGRLVINYRLSKSTSYALIAFALYFIAMLITTLLIVHFALALSIGLCALPLTFVQPLITLRLANNIPAFKTNLKIALCLLVSSPFFAVFSLGYILDGQQLPGVLQLMSGLLTTWSELQCWTWFVIALGWLPAWLAIVLAASLGDFGEPKTKSEPKAKND